MVVLIVKPPAHRKKLKCLIVNRKVRSQQSSFIALSEKPTKEGLCQKVGKHQRKLYLADKYKYGREKQKYFSREESVAMVALASEKCD